MNVWTALALLTGLISLMWLVFLQVRQGTHVRNTVDGIIRDDEADLVNGRLSATGMRQLQAIVAARPQASDVLVIGAEGAYEFFDVPDLSAGLPSVSAPAGKGFGNKEEDVQVVVGGDGGGVDVHQLQAVRLKPHYTRINSNIMRSHTSSDVAQLTGFSARTLAT